MIELAGRLGVPAAPAPAAVDRHRGALIGALGHSAGILGVDPDRVIVVTARTPAENDAVRATLVAAPHRLADQINDVGVFGIGGDAVEIIAGEGTFAIDPAPVGAAVVGPPQAAVRLRIDDRINAKAPRLAGSGEADPPEGPGRPACACESAPMRALVVRTVDGAPGTGDFGEVALPRPLPRVPGRREQSAGIVRVCRNVVRSGEASRRDRVRPCLPAIGRAVDAARIAGPEEMPDRGDNNYVRVRRADPDAASVAPRIKLDRPVPLQRQRRTRASRKAAKRQWAREFWTLRHLDRGTIAPDARRSWHLLQSRRHLSHGQFQSAPRRATTRHFSR